MAPPYQYSPLSHADETRLLHLQPGSGDDDIHFTLHPARLSEKPPYEAISYCWGDQSDTRQVFCDGKPLAVTNSLFTALRRLRKKDDVRVLWADAVCINQEDIPEKNKQVRLMSRIYSQPTAVLIWLGDDTSGLDGLAECIKGALGLLPPEHFEFGKIHPISGKIFRVAARLRRGGKPNILDHDWRPITHLLCRPWFGRRWIIQEVALADDSVPRLAICGYVEFSWNELASVAYRISCYGIASVLAGLLTINRHAPYMAYFLADDGKPFRMLSAVFMTYLIKGYRAVTLVDCVTATPVFQCSDPRDHLYSLLSLAQHVDVLDADYTLPAEEVCKRFAAATLVSRQDLKLLSLAPHTTILLGDQELKRLAGLPSWVPDLTCQGDMNPLVSYAIRPQLFHAVDTPFPTEEDVAPKTGFHARMKMRERNWLQECYEVAGGKYQRKKNTGLEESKEEAELRRGFLETLLCGMITMRDPIPEDVLAATQVYMDYLFDYFTEGFKPSKEVDVSRWTYGPLIKQSLFAVTECRRFCRTEQGRLGQVRKEAREGDVFVCIVGAEVPYLLRPSGEKKGVYTLVGDCFLLGVMQGEAFSDSRYETVDIAIE